MFRALVHRHAAPAAVAFATCVLLLASTPPIFALTIALLALGPPLAPLPAFNLLGILDHAAGHRARARPAGDRNGAATAAASTVAGS
jgi:hypothetical protein